MTLVKICGITNAADALAAVKAGANMLGFNFYRRSPRYIAPGSARDVIDKLDGAATAVGVFVNENIYEMARIAMVSNVDMIQLHGDEGPEYCEDALNFTSLNIIKAFRVSRDFDVGLIRDYEVDSILVDAFVAGVYGGTGHLPELDTARLIAEQHPRVYLAGGLNPTNVAEAVRQVHPFAVDVASGVESSPGKKDPNKLKAFIEAAKEAI